jgi:hypothetical protein
LNRDDFDIRTVDDEVRVDGLCKELLMRFYETLLQDGMPPEEATTLASGADYFARDFIVDNRRMNLFEERRGIVRQFGGNWYIVSTVEPNGEELERHLRGIAAFYGFLGAEGLVGADHVAAMQAECADLDFYRERIGSFWEISGDGFLEWERRCSLKDR